MGKILIVGANGAVGQSCISKLSNKDLVLISRSEFDDNIDNGSQITKHVLDINDYAKTSEFINNIDYEISGIIFAIGSITLKPFSSTSIDDFKKLMDDNFYNIVNFLNLSINKFEEGSSVVFFSTIASIRGFKNHAGIASAKSAIIGLSNSLAADYAPKIRFNTISPSLSYSKMSEFITSNEKVAEGLGKLHPMSRLGKGDDIASLASLLISPESSWITGQNFSVDGGRSTLITK
jgi:NAD(P)-dependent dehydrogenase (short-subunit alcohol dehydrogenase family)